MVSKRRIPTVTSVVPTIHSVPRRLTKQILNDKCEREGFGDGGAFLLNSEEPATWISIAGNTCK